MTILFISDLHLEEERPLTTALFLNFLKKITKVEALFILGDFFESWIGDDDNSLFNQKIIEALAEATRGFPIYFMHGNRDFLIGKKFLSSTGIKLLPDECVIDLYGTPTLLMHGDTLCTLDVNYLKFRKKSRKWLYKKLILFKSLSKRRELAKKIRSVSEEHTRKTPAYIMDVTQNEVVAMLQKHNVKQLIHGHTHRQGIHTFLLNNQPANRFVLGSWDQKGNVLVCEKNGRNEFKSITPEGDIK